jgi:hypothetical protein
MSDERTLTISIDPATYEILAAFAAQFSQSVEGTASALLTAELVRCTEAEHGPDLSGRIFTRGELLHLDLVAERARASLLQSQLDHFRQEVARASGALAKLVEGAAKL